MVNHRGLAIAVFAGAVLALLSLAWWHPGEPDVVRVGGELSHAEVSARVRLIARLGRKGRFNEANHEAVLLMQRAPEFSARKWVTDAYLGIRREDEREENIRLLVSLGLPEQAGEPR